MPLFGRTHQIDEAQLYCPRDNRPMLKAQVEGVTIDRCDACGGTWFDADELRRVAGDPDVERRATRRPESIPIITFDCPRCRGGCVEGWVEEVRVDACASCHGVWLDRGELDEARRQVKVNRVLTEGGDQFRRFLQRV